MPRESRNENEAAYPTDTWTVLTYRVQCVCRAASRRRVPGHTSHSAYVRQNNRRFGTPGDMINNPTTLRINVNGVPAASGVSQLQSDLTVASGIEANTVPSGSRGTFTICGQAKQDDWESRGFSGDVAYFGLFEARRLTFVAVLAGS